MIILQDTREQSPLNFKHPEVTGIQLATLPVGDYSALFEDGTESRTYFERKSLGDLFGSLAKNYKRFKREIDRAIANDYRLIIIVEEDLGRVFTGYAYSTVSGESIVKTMFSIWARYGVYPVFCSDREESSSYIIQYYWAEWRKKKSEKKLDKKNN